MFSMSTIPTTVNELMWREPECLAELTNNLADSILNIGTDGHANALRDIVKAAGIKNPVAAAVLKDYITLPSPKALNKTVDETISANFKKGTPHHELYKNMLSLPAEEKAELIKYFGATLTKFAVCNLIFLYTEGDKISSDKGIRNMPAIARKISEKVASAGEALGLASLRDDRTLKLEFFTRVLAELHSETPFLRYQAENFVSTTREGSKYPLAKACNDAAYLAIITEGKSVNVPNALTLFDSDTRAIVTNTFSAPTYAAGTQGLYSPPVADAKMSARSTSPEHK